MSRLNRFVALKILMANASTEENELRILKHLSTCGLNHPAKKHIMALLDDFEHQGPNGAHTCLVFEVMGPSSASMVEELPVNKDILFGRTARYPIWMAKSMLRQALLGIDYLHQSGIVHGDLQPGNLLFSVTGLQSVDEKQLSQDYSQRAVSEPVRRLDGKVDLWAPRYLALGQSLTEFADIGPRFQVKISDMEGGRLQSLSSLCHNANR